MFKLILIYSMKQITITVLLLAFSMCVTGQDLYVGSDSSVTLDTAASISINGLTLAPDSGYTIASNTNIEFKDTQANTGNISIFRHYDISPSLPNYSGNLVFSYQDAELNGIAETNLSLALLDTNTIWQGYAATLNPDTNTLSYNFTTAISFSIVTADFNNSLNTDNFVLNTPLTLYPNPTSGVVYIKYPYPVKTTVYSMLGQVLQTGQTHRVDLSLYDEATYILRVQDPQNLTSKTFKIIKK